MIVTIDGPAGAGKSSVARELAKRLGFRFLDTGAMYRAVVWAALDRGIELTDESRLAEVADNISIDLHDRTTIVDGQDVSDAIRSSRITQQIFHAADNVLVRDLLSAKQREWAAGGNIVSEGRDQGTVVFPDAECKIFLTASAEERAHRRLQDMQNRGEVIAFEEVLERQNRRDEQDCNRVVGRLVKALDAVEFTTDNLTPEQVIDELEAIVKNGQGAT